jgi:hypothetical protein
MKKTAVILPIIALLAFSACKRSYVCQCISYSTANNKFVKQSVSEETLGKLTNQDAEAISPQCESRSFDNDTSFIESRCQLVRK